MKTKKIIGITLSSFFALTLVGATVAANVASEKYADVLRPLFGTSGRDYTKVSYNGVDQNYYKNKASSKEDLKTKERKLAEDIAAEGFVVLEKGNLPYAKASKLSLFSKSSVDFVFGGTGSGASSSEATLKSALEESGFEVNNALWEFYANGAGKNYHRGIGSINYGDADDFAINEVPLSTITADENVKNSFSSYRTGVFVLGRTGGEGNDLARGMSPYVDTGLDQNAGKHVDAEADRYRSYLEPDSIELQIMEYINDNFDDFILIVNCNNAVELNFKERFPKLKTIIQVPASGEHGLNQLGKILNGEVASSGRLADTFVKDSFAHPSSQNIGDFEFLVNGTRMPNMYGQGNHTDGLFYMNYDESIYVGYRYFETRYADAVMNLGNASGNSWAYEDEVLYPFGYGDSLAKFSYDSFSLTETEEGYEAKVTVKNVGQVPGKEAVELYVSSPYGEYEKANHVEKSAIELLNFGKTKLLAPNEKEEVIITFTKEDLRSYSSQGKGGYYMAGGTYYFTFGKDAHAATNNVLKYQGFAGLIPSPSEESAGNINLVQTINLVADYDSWKKDPATGTTIENRFGFTDLSTYEPGHKTLSREDYVGTYPEIGGSVSDITSIHSERTTKSPNGNVGSHEFVKDLSTDSEIYKNVMERRTGAPELVVPEQILWNQPSNLDAVDLRGLSIDDPRYDEVVDKVSLEEATRLFSAAGYRTAPVPSINKPATFDTDGPAGFNAVSGHKAIGFSFPCSLLIASTWNKDLMHEVGEAFGEESLFYEIQGWYGPTANVHRNPFGGRNFEYFSEDPILTGEAAKQELHGAAMYGLYGYLKHFALNDQETHREKENGVCIFAPEIAIRGIYLKAFERAVKYNTVETTYYELQRDANKEIIMENGEPKFVKKTTETYACTAIMSSFSRLGGVWAGGCYPLLHDVLQEEWGFHGLILTDYYHDWFMNKGQSLLGAGTTMLDPQGNKFEIASNDKLSQYMLKLATKNNLYAVVNSNSVNGYIHGTKEIESWPVYRTFVIIADVVFIAGALVLGFNVIRLCRKGRKEEA